MHTEHLQYFVEVSKCHSIQLAAEKLFVTQPTISIALKNLEQELGSSLFLRSKNGMFLTKMGQHVLEMANDILAKEQELYALTSLEKNIKSHQLTGNLIITTIPMFTYTFFAETITQLLQKNPYIKLQILERSSKDAINLLLDNKCDIAFFLADPNELVKYGLGETLILRRLLTEKLYIVAASSFELSSNKSFSFSDVKTFPFATGYFDITENITEHYTLPSAETNLVLNTCNFDLILKLIANGTVVSSLINSMLPYLPQNADIDIIPAINPDKIDIYCAYRKADEKNDLIQAFISELMAQF